MSAEAAGEVVAGVVVSVAQRGLKLLTTVMAASRAEPRISEDAHMT